ncbi:sugar dehydrogenase complex small subunit [Neisseria sp. Ec49-e6-T10]|uniref:sugar dehydrogenase complex small subunit n=1 Tax=Neisseria sp. Ec49-e6-T10 TaxID=3140744 RepID=UPI003EB91755
MNSLKEKGLINEAEQNAHQSGMTRRTLLTSLGVLFASSVVPFALAQKDPMSIVANHEVKFLELSQFLTGKQLDPILANRVLEALSKIDSSFPKKAKFLEKEIRWAQLHDVDAFKTSTLFEQPELKETALTIISAWYLGYAGTPVDQVATDNTVFITYTQALMYLPTQNALVIPSYMKWGTNYWVNPPKFG